MEFLNIGTSGLKVSRLCFGCAGIGGYDYGEVDDAESIKAVRKAVDLGIDFFDVADVYGFGRAESILYKALGRRIRDINVATKFGVGWTEDYRTYKNISASHLIRSLEGSLQRLGCDSIPLYQLHWPDGETPLEEAITAMERLRDEGKILNVGVCNLNSEELSVCQRTGRIDTIQLPFSLAERQYEETLINATTQNTRTLVYNAIANGLFSGKYDRNSIFSGTDMRTRINLFQGPDFDKALGILERIQTVAKEIGKSCVQVAVNYLFSLDHVGVVIVGTKTAKQIEDSVGSVGWRLDQTAIDYLEGNCSKN